MREHISNMKEKERKGERDRDHSYYNSLTLAQAYKKEKKSTFEGLGMYLVTPPT